MSFSRDDLELLLTVVWDQILSNRKRGISDGERGRINARLNSGHLFDLRRKIEMQMIVLESERKS